MPLHRRSVVSVRVKTIGRQVASKQSGRVGDPVASAFPAVVPFVPMLAG